VVLPHVAVAEADRFLDVIAGLDRLEPFDVAACRALERRKDLIAAHAGSRPGNEIPKGPMGWTHGDFQPLNILWERGDVTAVLDWDRLAVRPCADELVRTAQVQFGTDDGRLDLVRIMAFVAGYRSVISLTDDDLEDAVRRLWWRRMTGFWQLHWHYEKGDHGPDALWTSGGHMLDWWCERQDEVLGAFLQASHPEGSA
jgi:Ser/Thr protein kinase RdoA (MazF antagonist)